MASAEKLAAAVTLKRTRKMKSTILHQGIGKGFQEFMRLSQMTPIQVRFAITVLLMLAAGLTVLFSIGKRKTQRVHIDYGGP
jgi:hypothetical protein